MKRTALFLTAAFAIASATTAAAQQLSTGGMMADNDIVMPTDLLELSQTQFNFGTARSMAMAGAFTSLGADLSSMSINPAGLGMYRHSDLSITPMVTLARADNSAAAWDNAEAPSTNARNRFAMGNIGFAVNVFQGGGTLTSLTIGFGYNRLADFNYAQSFRQGGNIGSIADMYSMQLRYSGLVATDIMGDNLSWNRVGTDLWNAVLGYKCGLTDDPGRNGEWSPTWIGGDRSPAGIDIGQYAGLVSRGSAGEYALSAGANLNNKFYVGVTLGIQSFYQRKDYYYAEDYSYPTPDGTDPELNYQLQYARLNQTVIVDGTGVNFKIGAVYRPVESLRIGAAFHTPTYYAFDRKFQGAMSSLTRVNRDVDPDIHPTDGKLALNDATPVLVDNGSDDWAFAGPSRLLVGLSYTLGRLGIVAIDYERAWYNGMRMKRAPAGIPNAMYNDAMRTGFKASNTVRAGLEVRPVPAVALRAGFGYSGSRLADDHTVFSSPATRRVTYCSAGVGFTLSRHVVLDAAYSYQNTRQTDYALYYADEIFPDGTVASNASDLFSTTWKRHNIALTLGFRF